MRIIRFDYPCNAVEIIAVPFCGRTGGGRKGGKTAREVKLKDRQRTVVRAKKDFRRLALANNLVRHFTFTFKSNVVDVDEADRLFKQFVIRLRTYESKSKRGVLKNPYKNFAYIATRERQTKRAEKNNDEGAVHYHLLSNIFVPFKLLSKLWGQGHVFAVHHKAGFKAIQYVCKYLKKELDTAEYLTAEGNNKKAYLSSKGLKKAVGRCKTIINVYGQVYDDIMASFKTLGRVVWDLEFEIESKNDNQLFGKSIMIELENPYEDEENSA